MTPDQEKELQKAAEGYCIKTHELDGTYSCQICGGKQQSAFIAGAKHQDAISRRDERREIVKQLRNFIGMTTHGKGELYVWGKLEQFIKRTRNRRNKMTDEEKSELILGFLKYLRNQNEHEFKLRDSNGDVLHFSEDREIFIEENLKRYLASLENQNDG